MGSPKVSENFWEEEVQAGKACRAGHFRYCRKPCLAATRRAPVNSPPGCLVCAEPICYPAIRAQTAHSRSRLHPQISLNGRANKKRADESQLSFCVSVVRNSCSLIGANRAPKKDLLCKDFLGRGGAGVKSNRAGIFLPCCKMRLAATMVLPTGIEPITSP